MRNWLVVFLMALALAPVAGGAAPARPNILWITSEDNGPHLGCYGDRYADTPNLDRLAARSLLYLHAWSNAPVCAPARTAIITGMYPASTGSQHMRSMTRLPAGIKMFPQYLRAAGYYCTNNRKEDYNLQKPGQVWDESSRQAHWKNRQPGQPFFAIFNHTVSHESQIRRRPHTPVHDPAKVRVPAYHPDTPEVRRDWAQYYDKMTEMDALVGQNLKELEEAGLADDTIVFYYGDHGSGMPRSKRWPYNSGLRVPLLVHIPAKFKRLQSREYAAGGKTDRLAAFVDLAPTVLSLAGIKPPKHMQGKAFLGEYEAAPKRFLHGFRGRMDERYDMVRSVRDQRYIYIRNYMPHKIYGQHIAYMFQTPTTRVWKRLHDEGKLTPEQSRFWERKPAEELYDLRSDPDEVRNLADSPRHQRILKRLRKAQREHALNIRDLGFLPEDEIHARSQASTPYEYGHDRQAYPLEKITAAAELATSPEADAQGELRQALKADDGAVRYWAAMGFLIRGKGAVDKSIGNLREALCDDAPSVRIVVAEILARYGGADDREAALKTLLQLANVEKSGVYLAMAALNALDSLDGRAAGVVAQIQALPKTAPGVHQRMRNNVPALIRKTLADLGLAE